MGYLHIDGAELYNTEKEIGVAIGESGVDRKKLFVTTKVSNRIEGMSLTRWPHSIGCPLRQSRDSRRD